MSSLSFASSSVQAQLDAANEEIAKLRNEVARHRDTSMNQSDTIRTLRENISNLADNVDELAAENGMLHARVHQLEGADQATVAASGDNTTSAPDGIDIDINTASAFSSLAIQPKQRACKFYRRGLCRGGKDCKFLHVEEKEKEVEDEVQEEVEEEVEEEEVEEGMKDNDDDDVYMEGM